MPVIVDAMGGDHAPHEIVKGALGAAQEFGVDIVLVGRESELSKYSVNNPHITVQHAESLVEMHEHPVRALRAKPEASISVAMRLLQATPGAALITAGNTGAAMASALMVLGRLEGIERPAIATTLPTLDGEMIAIDCGANVDCKPGQLLQFGMMGSLYARHVLGVATPRIGLLNNGTEEGKGNEQVREAFELLKASELNFVGNVEGNGVYRGVCDVMVTDGFVGNIFLKTSEGLGEVFFRLLQEAAGEAGAAAEAFRPLQKKLERFNPSSPVHAGAPLLGVEGCVIIAHGAARADTIRNAIQLGTRYAASGALQYIREACREPRPAS